MMQIELQPDESKIAEGLVSYQSPGGKKFNGKLTITSKRLLYDVEFDMSAKGRLPDVMFIKWGSVGYMEFDRADIKQVVINENILSTKMMLTLTDGSQHIFNSGMLGKSFWKAITANQ